VSGVERASAEELKRTLGVKPGDPLDFKKLNLGVSRVFGSGYFERVNYSLLNDSGRNVLAIDAREKSWGPNYLRFGLSLNADTVGEGRFNLLMRYLQTQFNGWGAEWRTDFQLGRDRRIATQFFQPLGASGWLNQLSVAPGVEYLQRPVDFIIAGKRSFQYQLTSDIQALDFGVDLSRNAILRLGISKSDNKAKPTIGTSIFAVPEFRDGGARVKFLYDSLDDTSFPREGHLLQVDHYKTFDKFGADRRYSKTEVNIQEYMTFKAGTFSVAGRYGRSGNEGLNQFNNFTLGGFQQLSGYRPAEFTGSAVALARVGYLHRLAQVRNPFGSNLYLGTTLEVGRTAATTELLRLAENKASVSLYAGFETLFGPLYLGFGKSREKTPLFYLFLGQP
ncbi:MAG: BamA/TamA family outer membrane protein, partial [Betaproteobacteria bacterium]|nr:BamA/TamA family outer membrane protein [Betaproteobacteria bacterium]